VTSTDEEAVYKLNEKDFNGRQLRVQEANNKQQNTRGGNNGNNAFGNSSGKSNESDTLKLNDLPDSLTEDDLRKTFSKYGNIRRVFHVQEKGFC